MAKTIKGLQICWSNPVSSCVRENGNTRSGKNPTIESSLKSSQRDSHTRRNTKSNPITNLSIQDTYTRDFAFFLYTVDVIFIIIGPVVFICPILLLNTQLMARADGTVLNTQLMARADGTVLNTQLMARADGTE